MRYPNAHTHIGSAFRNRIHSTKQLRKCKKEASQRVLVYAANIRYGILYRIQHVSICAEDDKGKCEGDREEEEDDEESGEEEGGEDEDGSSDSDDAEQESLEMRSICSRGDDGLVLIHSDADGDAQISLIST